jgi:hypothetical protein
MHHDLLALEITVPQFAGGGQKGVPSFCWVLTAVCLVSPAECEKDTGGMVSMFGVAWGLIPECDIGSEVIQVLLP